MNLINDLKHLFSNPEIFYTEHKGDVTGVLKLIYAIYLPLIALATAIAAAILPDISAISVLIQVVIAAVLIPIGVSITGAIYHLAVLVLGGRGIKNTITVVGAAPLVAIPYTIVGGLLMLTGSIIGMILYMLASLAALIHIVYTEVKGFDVHYQWGTGKGIIVSLAYPIILSIAVMVLVTVIGFSLYAAPL